MAYKRVRMGGSEFDVSPRFYWGFLAAAVLLFGIITVVMSFYTVDANENGVILRLGKYYTTTQPGLHMKIPWGIDRLFLVRVDYQWKEEFGFRTSRPGIKSVYEKGRFTDESWMLTGDLNIADVQWIVQYKINDPVAYLFNVRDQSGTIRDLAEASMRYVVGDRSFREVLQSDRVRVAEESKKFLQTTLDEYKMGISIQLVQLITVQPPDPVFDSFNEVNRAKQEQETAINEASQVYNKEIYRVQGEAERMIQEARGYAVDRINRAQGDAQLFNAVFAEYQKAREVTRQRLYLETMQHILPGVDKKYIVDEDLKGLIPLLNLGGKGVSK